MSGGFAKRSLNLFKDGLAQSASKTPAGHVQKAKIYGGLDINELVEKFTSLCVAHGAEYVLTKSWNGAGFLAR